MRGGAVERLVLVFKKQGLSPHARGSHQLKAQGGFKGGSIPACAGEPVNVNPARPFNTVYPRMRGGA